MNAPREELAWMVVIDPSLPWLMAFSIGTTSLPRTSPTMTRSGVIRSAHRTSSARVISPSPSMLASRDCIATTSGWAAVSQSRHSSRLSSMVISRSRGGIAEASARSRVVLPTAVPPETRMFLRALTTAARNAASWPSRVPLAVRPSRDALASRSRRMATHGLPVTAITANSRPPPGSGTLTRGVARSNRRSSFPARVAIARIRSVSSVSLPAMGAARTRRAPGVLDEHLVAAVGVDRLDVGVVEERLEAAQAEQRVEHRLADLPLGAGVQRRRGHRKGRGRPRRPGPRR